MLLASEQALCQSTPTQSQMETGFWEIGRYKTNVLRIRDGSEQLEEITKMIKERVDIESRYSQRLEEWNKRWKNYADESVPNGAIKSSISALLQESHEVSRLHGSIKDRFNDEVVKTIDLFKKANYHRSAIRNIKEVKEIEDEFEKAQKQWKKLIEKMETSRRNYHNSCRSERSAHIQMINSRDDKAGALCNGLSPAKSMDRLDRIKSEVCKSKEAYEHSFSSLKEYIPVYKGMMAFVFEKCQQMELKRMKFVMEMLSGVQKILVDLLNPAKLFQIHQDLEKHFSSQTNEGFNFELKQWSLLHGIEAHAEWPTFQEYASSLRINAKIAKNRNGTTSGSGVILTKKVVKIDEPSAIKLNSPIKYPNELSNQDQHPLDAFNVKKEMKVMLDHKNIHTKSKSDGKVEQLSLERKNHCNDAWTNPLDAAESKCDSSFFTAYGGPTPPPIDTDKKLTQKRDDRENTLRGIFLPHNDLADENSSISEASKSSVIFPSQSNNSKIASYNKSIQKICASRGISHSYFNEPILRQNFNLPDKSTSARPTESVSNGQFPQIKSYINSTAMDFVQRHSVPQFIGTNQNFHLKDNILTTNTAPSKNLVPNWQSSENINLSSSKSVPTHYPSMEINSVSKDQNNYNNGRPDEFSSIAGCRDSSSASVISDQFQPDLQQQLHQLPRGLVKVLYDYRPDEADEISLNEGEIIEVLSGPDELGWGIGKKTDNRTGLFPAQYVSTFASPPPE